MRGWDGGREPAGDEDPDGVEWEHDGFDQVLDFSWRETMMRPRRSSRTYSLFDFSGLEEPWMLAFELNYDISYHASPNGIRESRSSVKDGRINMEISAAFGYTGVLDLSEFLEEYDPHVIYNFQESDCDNSFIC